ncbi:hypothetical protein CHS0354_000300 [Potamilus streckersoni]|uniref:Uncharacterized protein n=1 Tax=Potamilus streckersoni TaxID=2493646 RepID=A0AAE0VKJ9_9BIVA|nr:hypothetical protein CHS0354_000300 [Potamilus streckersoni]
MFYLELKILKEEHKTILSVQNNLLTTQEELRNRVNELETKNVHLQRQFENLLNSCEMEKHFESNSMADFKLQGQGNATEHNMTNTLEKRSETRKTELQIGIGKSRITL